MVEARPQEGQPANPEEEAAAAAAAAAVAANKKAERKYREGHQEFL